MEDYSVGSLAELISGAGTGKKGKVVKKGAKNALNGSAQKRKQNNSEVEQPAKKSKKGKDITLRNGRQIHLEKPIFEGKKVKKQLKKKVADEEEDEEMEDSPIEKDEASDSEGDENEEDEEDDDDEVDESDEDLDKILAEEEDDDEEGDDDEEEDDDEEDEDEDEGTKVKEDKPEVKEDAKKTKAIPEKNSAEERERSERTVFVGNLPIKVTKEQVKKLFKTYGKIDSVRLRCVPVSDTRVPKKVALIKKDFHPDRNSLHAYVRFTTREDAEKAVAANGLVFNDHHLRVNLSSSGLSHEENKSIFVGNIPFNAEDEELWKIFEPCGKIVSVRLIRDNRTMIGKGFGYVNFASSDSVELALEMTDVKLKDRELRIKRCNTKEASKTKKEKPRKRFRKSKVHDKKEENQSEESSKKPKPVTVKKKAFQGNESEKKKAKKFKKNKADPKVKLAKQLAPKSA